MSLLKSLAKTITKVGKSATKIAMSTNPLGTAAAGLAKSVARVAPVASRALPGIGAAAAIADLGTDFIDVTPKKKRRRSKGISANDLKSFKRVARLINHFAAPVHHLKKSSYQPKKSSI